MNAHTVAEALNRVPGLFVNFNQGIGTLGSTSILQSQGSEDRHVLVLVDGIALNTLNGGAAETNVIPVGIIDRIEIVKGPASSSWGSSLGGVIHIITKRPGYIKGPDGSVRASYGEHDAQDYRGQVSGRRDRLGYYLFAGRQASNGPNDSRDFEKSSFYSQFSYAASNNVDLSLSLGYSRPETGLGDYVTIDLSSEGEMPAFWCTALLDATFTRELSFNFRLFRFEQEPTITNRALGRGLRGAKGELFQKNEFDEEVTGAKAKLIWQKGMHTTVFGVDFSRGDLDQTIDSGRVLQAMGAPEELQTSPDVEKTGIYLNDTITLDRWSITPGIRYDYISTTDSFISPSIGVTYKVDVNTILRGSVARGFTPPPLSWTDGGALFLEPNSSLEEESVWSYQAGVESAALKYLWIRGTVFRHEIDDVFGREPASEDPQNMTQVFFNNGDSRRQGFEIEVETLPFYNTSVKAGLSYVNLDPADQRGAEDIYNYNVGLTYNNPDILRLELFGHYTWWDAQAIPNAEYDDFIWDLNLSRRIINRRQLDGDLFFTCHNIFNGSHYIVPDNKNPDRWIEGGLRIDF